MTTKTKPPPMPAGLPGEMPPMEGEIFLGPPKPIGRRVCLYGQGGLGKTSLALSAPGPLAFFDLDESLHALAPGRTDVVFGIKTLDDFKKAMRSDFMRTIKTVVIDSTSALQDMVETWVLKNIADEKKGLVKRLSDFTWSKDRPHIYSTWFDLIRLFDEHIHAGRNIILVAHQENCVDAKPSNLATGNMLGPRIFNPQKNGADSENSVRNRIHDWLDDLFYLELDISDSKTRDSKKVIKQCSGSRSINTEPHAHHFAKTRAKLPKVLAYPEGSTELWDKLFTT